MMGPARHDPPARRDMTTMLARPALLAALLAGCRPEALPSDPPPRGASASSIGGSVARAPWPRAVDVCVGADHSCALDDAGVVRCWGDNGDHQVSPDDLVQTSVPTVVAGVPPMRKLACGPTSSCGVSKSSEVWCWGYRPAFAPTEGAPFRLALTGPVDDFTLTSFGGCAIARDHEVRCFPRSLGSLHEVEVPGADGATGFGPTDATDSRVCVTRAAKSPVCFRASDNPPPIAKAGSLPLDYPRGAVLFRDASEVPALPGPPANALAPIAGVRRFESSRTHGCGIDDGGGLICWGRATAGQLGDGVAYLHPPARVPEIDDAVSLSVGDGGACAVRRSGELTCWGRHADRDPPLPRRDVATPFRADEVAVGASLLDASRICARDAATSGWRCRFGDEWLVVPKSFVGRPKPALLDAQGGAWNLELHGKPTKTFFFSQIGLPVAAIGHDGYCAVDRKGALACGHCGACAAPRNALTAIVGGEPFVLVGSLTYDETRQSSVCAVTVSGTTRCYEIAQAPFGRAEPKPLAIAGLPAGAVDISSSGGRYEPNLTCVRTAAGEVYCFGEARYRLASSAPLIARRVEGLPPVVGVGTGGNFACAREATGAVWCWGSNRDGGAPDGAPLERPAGVVVAPR